MWVGVVLAAAAVGMAVIERLRPHDRLPQVQGWRRRAVALSLVQVAAAAAGSLVLGPDLRRFALVDAAPLGTLGGAIWGYVGITFLYYWWHRARHEVPLLWRTLHQVHHSPTRLELLTTYYKHPLEAVTNVLFGAFLLFSVLGLTGPQAAIVTTLCGLAEFFYHWNVRTPRWLRFVIQRPEAHRLHHELGVHAGNYADLPVWDLLFGTYRDPDPAPVPCGFSRGRERRLREMLAFSEVEP